MIRKRICVKIKFKVVSRTALSFRLNTGIISWAKVPESQKENKHGKTNSEYVPFFNFRRIGDNPNEKEQRPLAVSIRDRLILRKLAFKNSIQKTAP